MSTTLTFEKDVDNYRGGSERFLLSIGERDGRVVIGLAPSNDAVAMRACLLEIADARAVVSALENAIARVAS